MADDINLLNDDDDDELIFETGEEELDPVPAWGPGGEFAPTDQYINNMSFKTNLLPFDPAVGTLGNEDYPWDKIYVGESSQYGDDKTPMYYKDGEFIPSDANYVFYVEGAESGDEEIEGDFTSGGTAVNVDKTLTKSGYAADAKVVGDLINEEWTEADTLDVISGDGTEGELPTYATEEWVTENFVGKNGTIIVSNGIEGTKNVQYNEITTICSVTLDVGVYVLTGSCLFGAEANGVRTVVLSSSTTVNQYTATTVGNAGSLVPTRIQKTRIITLNTPTTINLYAHHLGNTALSVNGCIEYVKIR